MTVILLSGGTGQVGSELKTALAPDGRVIAPGRDRMDLENADSIRAALRDARPDVIVNAAGHTIVDRAEVEPELAMRVNGVAPGIMAEEARRAGALFVHYSTDYVFDGELDRPYVEADEPHPVNAYGKSKLAGERAVQAAGGAYLILRTSWTYGSVGTNFVRTILRLAREKPELAVVNDQVGSPSWARALAQATAVLVRRRALAAANSGIFHLSASGHVSRFEFARYVIDAARSLSGTPDGWAAVRPITSAEYPLPARRPRRPVTSKEKIKRVFGVEMPAWQDQVRAYLREFGALTQSRRSS
jgi:dTDP-4-dehydrorhamnose reductase